MSCAKGCFKRSFGRCFTKSLERLNRATLLLIDQRIISFGSFYYSFKKTEMHFQMSSDQSEATAKRVVSTDYQRWFLLSFSSSRRNHPIFLPLMVEYGSKGTESVSIFGYWDFAEYRSSCFDLRNI